MASLCLNMIVKNESHIIEETLECICKYFNLDYWVISDTGSTDNTIEIIENFFKKKNIVGEIHQEAWQDFAYNRNKALDACEGKADYVLFFDADDLIEGDFVLPNLVDDSYYLKMRDEDGIAVYSRPLIIKNHQVYHWKGVLHEGIDIKDFIDEKTLVEKTILGDYAVVSRRLGSRNLDPNKSLNDALILEQAFEDEQNMRFKARYAFYCAQSYHVHSLKDSEYIDKTIEWYKKRIKIVLPRIEIDDEVYTSYEKLGDLYRIKGEFEEAKYYWEKGTELDPDRAECWYYLAKLSHLDDHLELAYRYIKQCIYLPMPDGVRGFINSPVYTFLCWYEMCLIAWKLRKIPEAYDAFKKSLNFIPVEQFLTLEPVVKSFKKLIKNENQANLIQLKNNLNRLSHPDYLDQLNVPTICLNMIVKNESHVIKETLECLCKYIDLDYWVISDTGSTDNTIEVIEDFFAEKGIAGEIHHHEWVDFAHNRNLALDACKNKADYVIFFDADDLIQGEFYLPYLEHDSYYLKFREEDNNFLYTRCLIIKNDQKYKWKGVLHEVIFASEETDSLFIEGNYSIISRRLGNRNLDPKKALNDVLILEKALLEEKEEQWLSRYAFYCAQSYRGLIGENKKYIDKAIEWYLKRLEFIHPSVSIDDERYFCCEILGLLFMNKSNIEQALKYWEKGTQLDPNRAECWYQLTSYHRSKDNIKLAYHYAQQCVDLPLPNGNRLFVNKSVYEFNCLLEMCLITFKLKKIDESYLSFKRVLPYLPAHNFLSYFNPIVSSYSNFLKQESFENLQEMKKHLARLGRPYYLDGVMRM